MSLGSEENEPSDTNAFVRRHSDLILILLGSALLVCLGLVVLILYLCWRRIKDRKGKVEGFKPVRPRPGRIQHPPPSTAHSKAQAHYQKLRTTSHDDEDYFHADRPASPTKSRRESRVDISVHPPLVAGTIVGTGSHGGDRSRSASNNSLNLPSSGGGRRDKPSRSSVFFPKTPESSPVTSPPYATPISRSGDEDATPSPRTSDTGPYPDLPHTHSSAQQRAEVLDLELEQQLQKKQNLERIRAMMRHNVQARTAAAAAHGTRDTAQRVTDAAAAATAAAQVQVRPRDGRRAQRGGGGGDGSKDRESSPTPTTSTSPLRALPRHRSGSPSSRQPSAAATTTSSPSAPAAATAAAATSTVRRRDQATQSRHQALMQSMYEQRQSKHQRQQAAVALATQSGAPKRSLRRGNLASQGELRKPVLRLRASMYGDYPDGDLERARKRSHSLPNLCDDAAVNDADATEAGESPPPSSSPRRKASIVKAMSTAGFNLVYSYSTSRNTSPDIDDEVVGQYGAVMFSVRYERFLQAVSVTRLRCSQLPTRRRRGGDGGHGGYAPDTMVKCRLLPGELRKQKTRVVAGSRDPEFVGDVLTFPDLAESEVACYTLLFEVYVVTAINRSLAGLCVYHLCALPRHDEKVQVFRNLEEPSRKYRLRRPKKSF